MSDKHGKFIWYELMTTDTKTAEAFYREVVGWGAQKAGIGDPDYVLFTLDGAGVCGLMTLPKEACDAGAKPGWIGYVAVDDVDASVAQVAAKGGMIHHASDNIPDVGRFAVVADPQGAVLALFRPTGPELGGEVKPGTPGRTGWHELYAKDGASALAYYQELFGWKKGDAVDMGPMGTYQLFTNGGEAIGGMMNKPDSMPRPVWLYYFNVDGIDAAVDRVKGNGGQVINGPLQVPGGNWIVQCLDPQGAMFALVSQ